ncbi:hypothetical protein O6H91_21G059000 [Diphasiastrum complanatum]|uniref:Uncharacterized protein n=2 Tax=Diphasiastrum complanatum TaxID=34168 RepID=A0ACC2AM38_DIPCM|nr:hypothetical protein O6H91_21G059000 [Diphasiastrum complanatum]
MAAQSWMTSSCVTDLESSTSLCSGQAARVDRHETTEKASRINGGQEAWRTKQLWEEFFSDPSQWWDNRSDKKNPRFPDFKLRSTAGKALWVDKRFNPPWVHARLAVMVQGQEQGQSGFSTPETSGWPNPPWVKAKVATMALGQIQSDGGLRSWVADLLGNCGNVSNLCQEGRLKEALHTVELMVQQNIQAPVKTYACLLKECIRRKSLVDGKRVHVLILQRGLDSNIFLVNTLINMYAKCGSLFDARQVFDSMLEHNVFSWTTIISAYASHRRGEETINLIQQMQKTGIRPNKVAFVVLLKACARIQALEEGKQLHLDIIKSGFESDVIVGNTLVDMYAKCGCIKHACWVFNNMHDRNIASWNAMIAGYAKEGLGKEALNLYKQMKQEGVQSNNVTYVVLLKACASTAALKDGKQIHSDISKSGCELDVIVGNSLIDMYAKCKHIEQARQVFNNMHERNVVSWNAMIAGYAQQGLGKEALALYDQMKQQGLQPDNFTYVVLLKACASIPALEEGKQLHLDIIDSGFELDEIVGNTLVDMYAKSGCIEDARQVFNSMHQRNVVSWTAMIVGYAQHGRVKEALGLYEQMKQEGVEPNSVTYIVLLKACASIAGLEQGKQLHLDIIKCGFEADVTVGNSLVDMYAKCGCLEDASRVFNNMHKQNVVSWTSIIAGYAHQGLGKEALALYDQMKQEGVQPNNVTYVVLLKACASIAALEEGKRLHFDIIRSDFESDVIVGTTLVDMYAKCECIELARQVFNNMHERNVVSWNVLIEGYSQQGLCKEALALYDQMKQQGLQPDNVTYVVLLKACASIAALEQGEQFHLDIIDSGFELDEVVGNTLVDMYAKCGCMERARQVFNNMQRNVVSWNTIIAAYAQQRLGKEALALYEQMKQEGVQPDNVTYVVLLKACVTIAALEQGKQLHLEIIKSGSDSDVIVGSALVDMYAKCMCMDDARKVFNSMHERNVVSWNALIAGYAQYGLGKQALTLFEQMQREGIKPNEVTYVSVFSACSRSGLVDKGRHLFDSMSKDHDVIPTMDHYACMVDLLGRAGCLADAEDFISKMPFQPNAVVWMSLLGAASNHCNVEIGRRAFDCFVKLEPESAAAYVLLSNIYAAASRRDEVARITKDISTDTGGKKMPGCSWIEFDNQVHACCRQCNSATKQGDLNFGPI